jgi:hypothetical protein
VTQDFLLLEVIVIADDKSSHLLHLRSVRARYF